MGGLLASQEAEAYWDRRHRLTGGLRSGGHIGLSEQQNQAFYLRRLATLIELLGMYHEPEAPLRLLDAGCGRGYFADALARLGHEVTGVDVSPEAIAVCREECRGEYHVSRLHEYRWAEPYDVVYSIDVLFHILDDELWAQSLSVLAMATRVGGALILTDVVSSEPGPRGNYIVARSAEAYDEVLRPLGFVRQGSPIPYHFGDNPHGFHTFRRLD